MGRDVPPESRPVPAFSNNPQNVESYWNRVKVKLKRMRGCTAGQLASYLDEFMWKERHGTTRRQAFNSIMRDIAAQT